MNGRKYFLAFAAMAIGLTFASAQNYYDDDIYFDPSKATKKEQKSVNTSYDNAYGNYTTITTTPTGTTITNYPGPETYTVVTTNTRDVDEYNRRGGYESADLSQDLAVVSSDPYYYSRQLARFDNPDLLTQINDSIAQEIALSDPEIINVTINNYSTGYNSPNYWLNPWPWSYRWGYGYSSYWSNLYWNSVWYPGLSWTWACDPFWGWGWNPGWVPAFPPGCGGPVWGGPAIPHPNPRHPGARPRYHGPTYGDRPNTRPAGVDNGFRPNASGNPSRHGGSTTRPTTTRPNTTVGSARPNQTSTSSYRPQGSSSYRPNSSGSSSYRPSSGSSSGSRHSSGSSSSYRPSSSGGSSHSGGFGGGRSSGGGGGRGRH